MTKEEAITILRDCELNPCVSKDKEAVDMAIKALEQKPCDVNSEVIDTVIEWLKDKDIIKTNYQEKRARGELTDYMGQKLKTEIEELDFVQEHKKISTTLNLMQKTGHWMDAGNRGYADVDSDNIILYQEMCNRCKCLSYFRKSSGLLIGANYCPNCGRKMKSEV